MHAMMGLDHNLRSRTTVTTGLDHVMSTASKSLQGMMLGLVIQVR